MLGHISHQERLRNTCNQLLVVYYTLFFLNDNKYRWNNDEIGKKALEDGEQSEEVENFTLLNADGSVEAVLDEKMDNLLITSEAKVKLDLNHSQ